MLTIAASLPSPAQGTWYLGPLPIRAYAIAIGIGIVAAWWILDRRYRKKGGPEETSIDVALWMVLFGIVGARLYHVVSSPAAYFGENGDPARIIEIWNGGLGIWGAIPAGALGAWIALRRRGLRLAPFADALAPGLLVAQAIGRFGNYFNQELYGAPTTLPWGLEIDAAHRVPGYADAELLFHPTFLYEALWAGAMVLVLLWAERRFALRHGRVMWLYVMLYTAGRVWIEYLRIDDAETILGVRLNVWTSIVVFLLALYFFIKIGRRTRGDAESIWLPGQEPAADDAALAAGGTTVDDASPAAGEDAPRAADDDGTDDDEVDDDRAAAGNGERPADG
ncbi:prolipoprotein diacylglyceryl transferase [Georgenia sunbinii]|uniref:prolipoprotein diacylglyceryl transferase n=1 Tax=Georgenia sunbinii TaxID=3117728 RepID=UPI003D9C2D31